MNKLDNNGMTLVELVVSFMIVSVAMFYFFQTFKTVNDIYRKTVNETTKYVEKDYAIRIIDRYLSNPSEDALGDINDDIGNIIAPDDKSVDINISQLDEKFNKITVKKDDKEWFEFYKYID